MFCEKCGSILLPKKEGQKKVLVCSCGFKTTDVSGSKIKETVRKKEKDVEVIEKEDYETLPTMKIRCEKCGHDTAYYWTVQTRAGDEPETKFMKCVKCLTTWRDYD